MLRLNYRWECDKLSTYDQQQKFINLIKDNAKESMREHGFLASVTIAQACLESAWGTSSLVKNDNNLFGIKFKGNHDPSLKITQGSWATDDGGHYCHYESWDDSIKDHMYFLLNNSRYANLFGDTAYVSVCEKLQADGYATDPNYAKGLTNTIFYNQLYLYDVKDVSIVEEPFSINPTKKIASDDMWLSVRVEKPLVEQAIKDIIKLGFACEILTLA